MVPLQTTSVVVGIPAFNEERAIAEVVAGALRYAATVVVVDDGSSDATAFQAMQAGAHLIRHAHNRGKGAAVASLFAYAKEHGADVLVMIDGDGQHNPDEIPVVAGPCLRKEADIVVGSRFLSVKSAVPLHRSLGQRAFNVMTAIASGVPCSDSQSGFRSFSRRAFCTMQLTESSFSVECEQQFECLLRDLKLVEVPISCDYRVPEKRSAYAQGFLVLRRLSSMMVRRRVLGRDPASPLAAAPAAAPAAFGLDEYEPAAALMAD